MQSHINQPMDKQTIKQMYRKQTDIWIKNKQTDINNQTARVTLYSKQ